MSPERCVTANHQPDSTGLTIRRTPTEAEMIAVLVLVSGYHPPHPQRPVVRRTPVPAGHVDRAFQAEHVRTPEHSEGAARSRLLIVATTLGLGTACVAAPDITSVQLSFTSWATVAVALPVAALWLVPFVAVTDFMEMGDALTSGLQVATARKVRPSLPSTTFVETLTAFAEGAAVKLAASRAKMALAVELNEDEGLMQSALPSHDTPFTIDSSHEGMACVEFFSEDDGQLQWVCV